MSRRFRRHADALERGERSALYVTLMRAAAGDIESGGRVAELFAGVPVPPGSVPALRLLAGMHHLVLSGRAAQLAAFYPSMGGDRPPDGVWPVALDTIAEHGEWLRRRLARTVQTNEPGRSVVLYGALLWLVHQYSLPVRLLEIGASAGLNLVVDRFCYEVDGAMLGAPGSPVHFIEPWRPAPRFDLAQAADKLRIVKREGCDPAPLDPRDPEDRLTALAYIWPDEPERRARTRAALELAAADPPTVMALPAQGWLPQALAAGEAGQLTVIWQSVVRQYVAPQDWEAIERAFAPRQSDGRPVVWLRMEPKRDHIGGFQLTMKTGADERERLLARCGDHGPPVIWEGWV